MVLETLESVDWARLTHAYGNATNVPDLLWVLASGSRRERDETLQTLYSNIWHQGTVYEATSFAVPFLCELVRSASIPGRARILRLLQAIASAYPEPHTQLDPLWRELPSQWEVTQHAKNAHWARQAAEAVSAEVQTFLALLTDPAPLLRTTAAFTLAYCSDRFAEIDHNLQKCMTDETHPVVKGAMIHVWAGLWKKSGRSPDPIKNTLRRLIHDLRECPLVRLVSAIGLLQFLPEGKYPKLVRFLASALRKTGKSLERLSNLSVDLVCLPEDLASHQDLKLALFLDVATKPGQYPKEQVLTNLEMLCRERRSNFPKVVPAIGRILRDATPESRRSAAFQLSKMGTWVRFARETLAEAMHDPDSEVGLRSALALSKLRDPRILPFLLDRLAPEKHTDPPTSPITKTTPIDEKLEIQHAVRKHLNDLGLLLDALQPYGPAASEALPHLRILLTERCPDIQKLICNALAHVGPPAKDTIPMVAKLLRVPETQDEAAWAIKHWGLTATNAVPDLMQFLKDFPEADSWARVYAIQALGNMGPNALDALPLLNEILADDAYQPQRMDAAMKSAIALAVWRICRIPEVIELLIDELRERTKLGWATHGCSHVVETLETIGPAAKSAEPLLQKLLADPDGWARIHAARALWKLGAGLNVFLPVLIDDLLCRPLGTCAGVLAAECLADLVHLPPLHCRVSRKSSPGKLLSLTLAPNGLKRTKPI